MSADRGRKSGSARNRKRLAEFGRWIGVLAVVAFALLPLLMMFIGSLSPVTDLYRTPPELLPSALTSASYEEAFQRTQVVLWLTNSTIIAVVVTALNAVVGVTGAYATIRFAFPGRKVVSVGLLLSYLFPAVLLVLPLSAIIQKAGLSGSLGAVIVAHCCFTVPFSVWLMRAFIVKVPVEIEDAARIDGCGEWKVFWRVTLPLSRGGLIATSTFAFIMSWNEYLFASVLSSGKTATLPVGIAGFVTSFDVRLGAILAVGAMAAIPVLVVFAIFQRHVEAGMLQSGLKG
jgi:ABC-type glycerol-3-phosphate transport system permease component